MPRTILALDVATVTGWAFGPIGDPEQCNAVRFGPKHGTDEDCWYDALKFVNGKLDDLKPDIVAIEAPPNSLTMGGQTNLATMGRLLGLQAVIRTVVRARRPSLARLIHLQAARKFFISHGNLPGAEAKARVRRRCIELGWLTEDNATYDKADALCVFAKASADIDQGFAARLVPLFRSPSLEPANPEVF